MGSLHVSLAKRGVPDHLCWAWDFFLHAVILDRVRQSNQGGEVMEEDGALMKKAQRKYAIQQAYRMACNKRGTAEGCNLLRRRSCIFCNIGDCVMITKR